MIIVMILLITKVACISNRLQGGTLIRTACTQGYQEWSHWWFRSIRRWVPVSQEALKPGTHYPHVTWAHITLCVLLSTPSQFLPILWLSYADLYNRVTWRHIKMSVGAIFNKLFFYFWKQIITMLKSTRHVLQVSRNVCDNRNLRGVLAREPTRAPRQITWRNQSGRSVSVRQNSMLKIPTALVTSHELTWREDSVSPA
jgi:hypothetical protein